ncbi:unnamed protein product [Rhizoctonia solani]|uniref:Uncharacterized protein n=1 Tax=Rhizoctonia solani TaxID=456999 RepID=A0A8H3H9W4_9AGAM|nr:unnamed protein product [Rhizoctonia solani]
MVGIRFSAKQLVIDPTPHHRFLRLAETRDILRPNIALNLEGLGEYADRVSQDWPVKFPVMVFQVACRETLEATRDDIWRYLWLSDGCRVGIIFIVNSLYDQHLKPFKLSVEIWSKQPIEQECPYSLDDCPPPPNLHKLSQAGEDKEDAEVIEWADDQPVVKRNDDGLLTYKPYSCIPAKYEPLIIMRHREEIVVIDETKEQDDILKDITFWATDFMPMCTAQLDQDVIIKSIKISLDSLRKCVRREWKYCRTPA